MVKELWARLGLQGHREQLAVIESARDVIRYVTNLKREEQLKMVIGLWSWWSERNRIREEGQRRPVHLIVKDVEVYAGEILQFLTKVHRSQIVKQQKWRKPSPEVLKLNTDASFRKESGDGGWGYIIRDSDGDTVIAGRGRLPHLLDPFQAELIACLQGIQAAIDIGITKIIVETDAVMVKFAVEAKDWGLSVPGRIIQEIQELASLNFVSCIFFCSS